MLRFLLISALLCVAQVSAFTTTRFARTVTPSVSMMAEKSKSLPFLERPAALDGSAPVRSCISIRLICTNIRHCILYCSHAFAILRVMSGLILLASLRTSKILDTFSKRNLSMLELRCLPLLVSLLLSMSTCRAMLTKT